MMSTKKNSEVTVEIEDTIEKAMSKIGAQKESEICRYIPGKTGYIHHFSFQKLKKENPRYLSSLIQENILQKEHPEQIHSPSRGKSKGKRVVDVRLKRSQINRLMELLKNSGDRELLQALIPYQSFEQVQAALTEMVKAKEVDRELWETYVRMVEKERALV